METEGQMFKTPAMALFDLYTLKFLLLSFLLMVELIYSPNCWEYLINNMSNKLKFNLTQIITRWDTPKIKLLSVLPYLI